MRLIADGHIPVRQIIHLCRDLLRTHDHQDILAILNLRDHIGQIRAVHGEVNHLPSRFFPAHRLALPGYIGSETKVAAPTIRHIIQALFYMRIATGEKHLFGSESPGYQAHMSGDPLVTLRPVPQTQNHYSHEPQEYAIPYLEPSKRSNSSAFAGFWETLETN